jgi:hypothetical protein
MTFWLSLEGTLEDHLEKLNEVLRRLRDAGLKVNAAKSFFCTHEIEYLGYILARGGIKPQQKKVQAILMRIRPIMSRNFMKIPWNGTILP